MGGWRVLVLGFVVSVFTFCGFGVGVSVGGLS